MWIENVEQTVLLWNTIVTSIDERSSEFDDLDNLLVNQTCNFENYS